jgi:hypothetical protein
MNFSSILDISSFFIGIIINLLFVALMCYYFKSKYDNLEIAQNEQAKILYELIQKERRNCAMGICPIIKQNNIEICPVNESDDSESESESESDSESESESDKEVVKVKQLTIQPEETEEVLFVVTKVEEKNEETKDDKNDYGKMTMKQLKELLSNKGIKPKPNMRKEELIELIQKDIPNELIIEEITC